jgi:hypothetical protein
LSSKGTIYATATAPRRSRAVLGQFGQRSCERSREAQLSYRSLTICLIVISIAPEGKSLRWCGRRDLNPHSLTRSRFSYHFGFRRRLSAFVVWTVPSPWPSQALGATRPVSTPSPNRGLGSGLAWGLSPLAFPDFERFYSADFPTGTPIKVCCVYRFRHVRTSGFVPHRAHARNCGVHPILPS